MQDLNNKLNPPLLDPADEAKFIKGLNKYNTIPYKIESKRFETFYFQDEDYIISFSNHYENKTATYTKTNRETKNWESLILEKELFYKILSKFFSII